MWPGRTREPWAELGPKGTFLLEASVCSAGLVAGILLELTVSPTAAGLIAPAGLLVFATAALLCVSQDMSQRVAKRRASRLPSTPTPAGPQEPQLSSPAPEAAPAEAAPQGLFDWLLEGFACCSGRGAEGEPEPLIPAVLGQAAPAPAGDQGPGAELRLVREDERGAMEALAKELAPEIQTLPPWDEVVGERCLLRFYRGHGTVQAAAQAYRKMLEWRKEQGADDLRAAVAELPWSMDAVPGMDKISEVFPIDINAGSSPEGNLVWIERNGCLDVDKFRELSDKEFQRTWGGLMELRTRHLDDLSREREQLVKVVQVRDLRGFSASLYFALVSSGVLPRLQSVILGSMAAHPESVHKVVMLNMPSAFKSVWALMQPLLTERMREKFLFLPYPHDARALHEVVGTDALLSLAKLGAPSLPCPGAASTSVAAEDFVELALRVPAGGEVRWSFSGSAELEFSVLAAPCAQGAAALEVVAARRDSAGQGGHVAECDAVYVIRWCHTGGPWSSSRKFDYSVELI